MKLYLSLPVLLVAALWLLSEGPAPVQAAPDLSGTLEGIPEKVKEFGRTVEETTRSVYTRIKESEITSKAKNWFLEALEKVKETWKKNF
ncbi:apolipoprotein C-I [Suncus etruscus]|uniref:apolipoprotein C-I-like n=1 Tax=Suncus etruscus TaxID=109475 RepID=UPI00210F33C5|nr:apolipoprotein C-I-like [Suncus etruscus]XP_049643278.1 apolipoprotein C-I [Suncus etruscus]